VILAESMCSHNIIDRHLDIIDRHLAGGDAGVSTESSYALQISWAAKSRGL
jgi:hypothetical protein